MAPPGKFYYIKSNDLVLDIKHCSNDPGTPVILWEKKDEEPDNQLWYDDLDTMTIRSKANDLCFTVKGARLCIDEYKEGNEDQRWIFRRGRGIIQNGDDRDAVLDIDDCDSEAGAGILVWRVDGPDNQLWDCERVAARYFVIRSRLNGLVLDIEAKNEDEGAKVIMWEETGEDNQLWWEDDHNVIRSKLTGFALQGDDDKGEVIRCYKFDEGKEEQHWIRNGRGLIINRFRRDRALDIKAKGDDKGADVIIWERHGEENQQFDFEFV